MKITGNTHGKFFLVYISQHCQLTSTKVSSDRSTCSSIPSTIYGSDSKLIYHTGAGVTIIIHCEVKLWDVDYPADRRGAQRNTSLCDVNSVPDVRINSCYVQTKWSIPNEVDDLTQRLTLEVADSIKQACRNICVQDRFESKTLRCK